MFEDRWILSSQLNKKETSSRFSAADVSGFSVLDAILEAEGVTDRDGFLHPETGELPDPMLLHDMEAACDRIISAVEDEEHIVIFGDYDTDGVTATSILYDFLAHQMEADCEYMLPSRFGGGYGLSASAIDAVAAAGASLLITVDNGISAEKEIRYARELGIDTVVTDHHDLPEVLPECAAVVAPLLSPEYENQCLCGCGVAYRLVEAISCILGFDDFEKYLPFAALGTVGDVVALTPENRTLVARGISAMENSEFSSVQLLREEILSQKKGENRKIKAIDFSFGPVPLLNAAGRIGDPDLAVDFLLSANSADAKDCLAELKLRNEARKIAEADIFAEIESGGCFAAKPDQPIVVCKGDGWNHGVTGIAASKVTERYRKPSVLFAADGESGGKTVLRGSCRSTDALNIMDVLNSVRDLCIKCGGHPKAAGLSIYEEDLPEFILRTEEKAREIMGSTVLKPAKPVLLYLPPERLSLETAELLQSLEPTGEGNRVPIFITDGIRSMNCQTVGEAKTTLRATVTFDNGSVVNGVQFGGASFASLCVNALPAAVIYTLEVNEYMGNRSPSMKILDFVEGLGNPLNCFSYEKRREAAENLLESAYTLTRDELASCYRFFRYAGKRFTFGSLHTLKTRLVTQRLPGFEIMTWFKIRTALDIFTELGFLIRPERGVYEFCENQPGKRLEESVLFRELNREIPYGG